MKEVYSIILTPAEKGYVVTVPDLEINTEGDTLAEAISMARDAIGLWGICEQDAGRTIPQPSTRTPKCAGNEISTLVDIDFDAYRRANDMKTIRKNVTLPSWLNAQAEEQHINFSSVLQAALKQQMHISE
ncbi:MAG: type II toxin-antitoxin system HicB family antitoxin [Ruthenibacterium sp.]